MKELAQHPKSDPVALFYTTKEYDAEDVNSLEEAARAAQVNLHVLWDERDGFLDAEHLMATVPDWKSADIWFCGPSPFGQILKKSLIKKGFPERHFHQELFEMR